MADITERHAVAERQGTTRRGRREREVEDALRALIKELAQANNMRAVSEAAVAAEALLP